MLSLVIAFYYCGGPNAGFIKDGWQTETQRSIVNTKSIITPTPNEINNY